jgi:hypothetical protein
MEREPRNTRNTRKGDERSHGEENHGLTRINTDDRGEAHTEAHRTRRGNFGKYISPEGARHRRKEPQMTQMDADGRRGEGTTEYTEGLTERRENKPRRGATYPVQGNALGTEHLPNISPEGA